MRGGRLPRGAGTFQCVEDGQVAGGGFRGYSEDADTQGCQRVSESELRRPASADFFKCGGDFFGKIGFQRIDIGEPVTILMLDIVARPAQRKLEGEAQTLT